MKIKLHHLYILTTSIAMLMYFGLNRTVVPWWLSSLHCLIWIMIRFCKKPMLLSFRILDKERKSVLYIFATVYLIFWASTIVAWFHNSYIKKGTITRSLSLTLQVLLMFLSVLATFDLFGRNLVKYTFYAAIMNNCYAIIFAIARWGIKDFLTVGLLPFSSASFWDLNHLNVTAYLEIHDVTFAFGLFLIYFLLFDKGKSRIRNIVICSIFIYLGLKRIQLAALLLIIGLSFIIKGKSKRSIKFWTVIYSAVSLTVVYAFIWLIDSNIITQLAAAYNINFMGRLRVYKNLSEYFTFSPTYLGQGMSFSRIIGEVLMERHILNFTGHSDVLINFIDYGFWGFTLWMLHLCCFSTLHINKKYGADVAKMWIFFGVYALITYLTDNTLTYFAFQSVYMIIILHMLKFEKVGINK